MTKPLVKAHEWGPVDLPAKYNNAHTRARLVRYGRFPSGEMFSLRRDRLYARNMAGFLDIGTLQVQVLPKIYSTEADGRGVGILLRMMAALVPELHAELAVANVAAGRVPPLETIMEAVADRLYSILSVGLPRRYVAQQEYAQVIRGRIEFAQMARRTSGLAQWVPVRYAALSIDNNLARVCRALIDSLLPMTTRDRTRTLLRRCLADLHGVRRVSLTLQLVDSVQLSRLEERWVWPLALARVVAAGQMSDAFTPGNFPSWSLVFPLDRLFEALVAKCVDRAIAGLNVSARRALSLGSLLRWAGDIGTLALKPDVTLVNQEGVVSLVCDAKWKRLEWQHDRPRLSREDVYQMTAYLTRAGCERGILFFPANEPLVDPVRVRVADILPHEQKLAIIELDIARFATLNKRDVVAMEEELRKVILLFTGSPA